MKNEGCKKNHNNKKIITILIISIISIGFLSGCISKTDSNENILQKRITIGVSGDILGFYPWFDTYDGDTMSMNANIFNSLVELNNNIQLSPGLAQSWSNPNNRTWRFFLRDDVTFHNGNKFTAEDVKYTIEYILNSENNEFKGLISSIESVEVIDTYTVDIITIQPVPTLLNNLVDIFMLSKEYQETTTEEWPIGTGGYKLSKYVEGETIVFERFEEYWKFTPDLKKINVIIIEDSEQKKDALLSKTIDLSSVHPIYYEEVLNTSYLQVKKVNSPLVIYINLDYREYDSAEYGDEINPLSNVLVRKAIYHAIDVQYIIDTYLNGFGTPTSQFVSPHIYGFNPEIQRLDYDITTAKQLMKDAGYENGFAVTFDCYDDNTTKDICNTISEQLSQIGINAVVNPLGLYEFYPKTAGNSSMNIIGWICATADGGEIYDYILRTRNETAGIGIYNDIYYSNPLIDEIGEKVASMMDLEERLKLMQDGFKIAMDEVAWVPLYTGQGIYAFPKYIDWNPRSDLVYKFEEINLVK